MSDSWRVPTIMSDPNDFFRPEEIKRFFSAINKPRDRVLFEVMLKTGRRVSEVVRSLKPEDIVYEHNIIRWNILKKKGFSRYKVPIEASEEIVQLLKKYIETFRIRDDQYIFPISRIRVNQIIRKYGKKANIPESRQHVHIFRHTFGTQLARSGMRIELIRYMLQHSNLNMTMQYLHHTSSEVKEQLNKMWT